MNRLEWQGFAERWLVDAKALLGNQCWSAAYYLAGYAVECGLKACVLARVEATPEVVFEDKMFSANCWTHNVEQLLKLAGLRTAREEFAEKNVTFGQNWGAVSKWNETARYKTWTQSQAEELYAAIADNPNGVLQWMRDHW